MTAPLLPYDAGAETLVRRDLRLRRLVSVQRAAIRRAIAHGESRGTVARLANELTRLERELDDVTCLLRETRRSA